MPVERRGEVDGAEDDHPWPRCVAGDEHLHAVVLALAVGAVGQHGGAARGEKTAGVVGDRVVDAGRSEGPFGGRLSTTSRRPTHPGSGCAITVGDGDRTMRSDVIATTANWGKVLPRHRLGEDVDDAAAREADGECVVVGDPVAMQFGSPGLDDLVGEFVDSGLHAATGHRARDRAVGSDDHGGAGWTWRRLHGADDGGDARCPAGPPNREQLVEYVTHDRQSMPLTRPHCASAQR